MAFRPSTLLVIASIPLARATFTIARCCTLAAREDFEEYVNDYLPWELCNFNQYIDYSSSQSFPSIVRPMSWAKEHCSGIQYSTTSQWLIPLATYISPYAGLLLLCPLGEDMTHMRLTGKKSIDTVIHALRKPVQESLSILGDPASAIFGAFSEVFSDTNSLRRLTRENTEEMSWLQQRASWITTLLGGLKFSSEIGWRPEILKLSGKPLLRTAYSNGLRQDLLPDKNEQADCDSSTRQFVHGGAAKIDKAINLVITARASFSSGILIPTVLMLAVTAATIYDAYDKTGDKNTALDLAYCLWYSWLLIVGMASNCFASAINHDLAHRALGEVINLGKEPVSVALRERYVNNQLWNNWELRGGHAGTLSFTTSRGQSWRFWFRLCMGQLFGWSFVAFASAAATALAWTTPTYGLGCRAFNFVLYASLAFLTASLHIVCSWLNAHRRQHEQSPMPDERNRRRHRRRIQILFTVRSVYWFFVMCNALVMILGTMLHLVGVFRTCRCDSLWSDDNMIELNNKTASAVRNAQRYWLPISYVTFGVMWLGCVVALMFRAFIARKMEDWLDNEVRTVA